MKISFVDFFFKLNFLSGKCQKREEEQFRLSSNPPRGRHVAAVVPRQVVGEGGGEGALGDQAHEEAR